MFAVPEELSSYHKSNVDRFVKIADAAGDAAEQWFELHMKSAKAASTEAAGQVRALVAAKDVHELSSLQTTFAQANAEKMMGYGKAVYAWASDTYAQVTRLTEHHIADTNKSLAAALDKAAKAAPAGSEYAFTAVKSAMSTANQAYDALTKASKQVVEITEATVTATASTAGSAARRKAA
jgi:phasin family protein